MQTLKTFLSYIFSPTPGDFNQSLALGIFTGLVLLAAISMYFIYKTRKKDDPAFRKLFKKTTPRLFSFGFFFLFYGLIRYEAIPYFSMRLWFYAALILFGVFLYFTGKTYLKDYPREKHNVAQIKSTHALKKEAKRYLPNKKRK